MTGRSNREAMPRAWRSLKAGDGLGPGLPREPADDAAAQRRSNIVKKLHPDQKGTRRLTERFGERLVCVRYRTDPESGRRFTTVEIVVEERAPTLPQPAPAHKLIRIGWGETELRETIKAHGGIWVRDKKLWKVPPDLVRRLKLGKRVVPESA